MRKPSFVPLSLKPSRSGNALIKGLIVTGLIGVTGWALVASNVIDLPGAEVKPVVSATTHTVQREQLLVTVTEDGKVESAKNVDIKCEVAGGSQILTIKPDGVLVEKGDELVTLDSSTLEEQLRSQKGVYEKALAAKIQADEDAAAAAIGVEEYLEGTFKKGIQDCEATITIALENLRSSENILQHSLRMSRKGFVTPLQVEADQFAVQRAQLELESAKTAKTVLEKYTKAKTLKELEGKRDAAKARARSENASVELEKGKLDRLTGQLAKCIVRAPSSGMVVYYKESSRFGSQGSQIQEGAAVREHQTMIQLPDLSRMQARVPIHESKVELVKPGMRAILKVLDKQFQGTVVMVSNQPDSKSFFQAQVNDYPALIQIDGSVEGLRPGYTAEVEILIADLKSVLTVPVSAVVEQGGQHKCWIQTASGSEERPLVLGMTNDKVVEVKDGLSEGDKVILNPRAVVPAARTGESVKGKGEVDTKEKFGEAKSGKAGAAGSGAPVTAEQPAGGAGAGGAGGGGRRAPTPIKVSDLDKNKDGKIDKDEASEDLKRPIPFLDNKSRFELTDKDNDGFISQEEADAANKAMRERMQQMQQGGGGAGGGRGGAGGPGGGGPGG